MTTGIQRTTSGDTVLTVGLLLLIIGVWAFILAYGLPYLSVPETHWVMGLTHFIKWPTLLVGIGYIWGQEDRSLKPGA
jgi:hypothetical protein